MPPALLRAYSSALSSVRAAESLERIADLRVGDWPIRRSAAQERSRELSRTVVASRRAKPANRQRLAAAGIRVVDHRSSKGG